MKKTEWERIMQAAVKLGICFPQILANFLVKSSSNSLLSKELLFMYPNLLK